jgi:putative membrane protein
MPNIMQSKNTYSLSLIIIFFILLAVSAIHPHDYFTWFLEIVPALLALAILTTTYKRFRFSNFTYTFIFIHALILVLGGHYTYAEVPFGYWMKDIFDFSRNHYDRVGHFAQGFVPALVARELIIKKNIVHGYGWQIFFIIFTILGFSAFYEFFEWWTAIATGEAANAFLGTQGDIWDTQWDMFMCFSGSIVALLFLSKLHDKYVKKN